MTGALIADDRRRPASAERPPRAGHVAALDGLRGVAILGVMLHHAGAPGARLGWVGVDLFFVLSGFLITTLLVVEHGARGRVGLARFWGRRFLRLMPLYALYAGFLTVVILVVPWGWVASEGRWTPGLYVASVWGYLVNFAPAYDAVWEHQQAFATHLWSLALEEQYYFAWPVLCALLLGSRWLPKLAWGLAALTLLRRGFAGEAELFSYPTARGVGLLVGSAVALSTGWRGLGSGSTRARWGVVVAAALVVATATAAVGRGWVDEGPAKRWLVPLVCSPFAATVAMLWHGPRDALARILGWSPLAYVGKVSYGMYVLNPAAHHLTWAVLLPGLGGWPAPLRYGLRLAVFLGLTVGPAAASHRVVEGRFLRLKERLR